jgi:hypothetical protein
MYDQLALSPVFMLRIPAKVARWLTGALAATALVFAMLIHPQHPDQCDPEMQGQTPPRFSTTQTVSPTTVSPFNQCPGGPQFSVGDFKLH